MFKRGDLVVIRKRPHSTTGCELFHLDTEELKLRQTILEIEGHGYVNFKGQNTYHVKGYDWIWMECDLEPVDLSLENE